MPTVTIPDELIPRGWEVTGEFRKIRATDEGFLSWRSVDDYTPVAATVKDDKRFCVNKFDAVILRRKPPVLKSIVFDIAGPARKIEPGEWYMARGGSIFQQSSPQTPLPYTPLLRREVYEDPA